MNQDFDTLDEEEEVRRKEKEDHARTVAMRMLTLRQYEHQRSMRLKEADWERR